MIALVLPSMLLGGLGRRIAGGVLNQWFKPSGGRVMGDTPARLIYGGFVGMAAAMGGAPYWAALAMMPCVWVGTTTGNWSSMAMGRAKTTFLHDFFGMSAHAFLSALLPVGLAAYSVHWHAAVAALFIMLAAPLYALGWMISGKTGAAWLPTGFKGGSELGEFFWGAATGAGVFLAYMVK